LVVGEAESVESFWQEIIISKAVADKRIFFHSGKSNIKIGLINRTHNYKKKNYKQISIDEKSINNINNAIKSKPNGFLV
jgi:hypothetical protein